MKVPLYVLDIYDFVFLFPCSSIKYGSELHSETISLGRWLNTGTHRHTHHSIIFSGLTRVTGMDNVKADRRMSLELVHGLHLPVYNLLPSFLLQAQSR